MPVHLFVGDSAKKWCDLLLTGSTCSRKFIHVAINAERTLILGRVAMTAQVTVAAETAEVVYVPGFILGECVLFSKYQFIASAAPWIDLLAIVTPTEVVSVLVEIDQVAKQLVADAALKARRMPEIILCGMLGCQCHILAAKSLPTTPALLFYFRRRSKTKFARCSHYVDWINQLANSNHFLLHVLHEISVALHLGITLQGLGSL